MSELKATVQRITIEEHPNADALELAVIGGYRAIVRKGDFQTGDLVVYIPEQSVLPQWLVQRLGLEGRLAGKESNRVKAIKLRGVLSQGLVYPLVYHPNDSELVAVVLADGSVLPVEEGDDVTSELGIVKYEPVIPTHMAGEVWNASGMTVNYDIENWKNYPNVLEDGEEVVFTEKIHGTWCSFGFVDGYWIVSSKGLSSKGLALKLSEANKNNLYVKTFDWQGMTIVKKLQKHLVCDNIHVLGEIFGKGVQDLSYGSQQPEFRVFDVYLVGEGRYLNHDELAEAIEAVNENEELVKQVPVLYRGPFSVDVMEEYTSGTESVSGNHMNIREGIVMRPVTERDDMELGRVILKSVSEDYLLRKGGTEFN